MKSEKEGDHPVATKCAGEDMLASGSCMPGKDPAALDWFSSQTVGRSFILLFFLLSRCELV